MSENLQDMLASIPEDRRHAIEKALANMVVLEKRSREDTMRGYATSINELRDVLHHRAVAAGWPGCEFGTRIALSHSELSEALEAFRKDLMDDHLPHRKGVEVELADCVIRILDLCGEYDLDIGGAIIEKAKYNLTRKDHTPEARSQANGKKF